MKTYSNFVTAISKFKLFFVLPASIVYLVFQLFLFDSYTWVPVGILLYYFFHQFGYSIGFHKLFSHRTFTPVVWFPYVAAVIGSICFFGNPIMSSIVHRCHHRHADTELDPHSPVRSRWHAFFGWLFSYRPPPASARIAADLVRDFPFLKTYEKIEWIILPAFYITVAFISKWLLLACLLGAVLSFLNGLCINAFSHNPHAPGNSKAVNNIFLARFVNSAFLHKEHHEDDSQYDYSIPEVKDLSAFFIRRFLIKSS
jgi:fatty-acid desaturase